MAAVSEATFAPLAVDASLNDVVMTCHDGTRLIAQGRSDRFIRIEIKMLAGRSDQQKRALRASLCQALERFGITDADVKMIVTDVAKENLGA